MTMPIYTIYIYNHMKDKIKIQPQLVIVNYFINATEKLK